MANILIFGAGAVGQYIGGLLTQTRKHKVKMVGRADHYNAISSGGLTIQKPGSKESILNPNFIPLIERISHMESFDWIFLTVKAYDLKKAVTRLRNVIRSSKNVRFLLFQRGVGSHEVLKGIIPDEKIVLSALTANVSIIDPGSVVQTNHGGALCIAPLDRATDITDLEKIFTPAKIDLYTFDRWRPMKWSALLYEILTNALCALTEYKPEKIIANDELLNLDMKAFDEGVQVIKKLGLEIVDLPAYNVKKLIFLNKLPGFMKNYFIKKELSSPENIRVPTLKIDMEKAKKYTEVDYLNGAIGRWGKERGVNTPVNDFLAQEITNIVTGKTSWSEYRKQPQEVVKSYRLFMYNYRYRE